MVEVLEVLKKVLVVTEEFVVLLLVIEEVLVVTEEVLVVLQRF